MIRFTNPSMTERQAAEKFAATFWEKPRQIGAWEHRNGRLVFQLIDGVKWYQVILLPKIGWEITDAE